jgi:hypothetical protein
MEKENRAPEVVRPVRSGPDSVHLPPAECHRGSIGDMNDISQSTVSRIVTEIVPLVKAVLEEFVPSAEDAIEMVKGQVVLVDGTLAPCWSYEEHQELRNKKHKTTGFNAPRQRSPSVRV